MRAAVIPRGNGDDRENDDPEPPAALGRLCSGGLAGVRFGKVYRVKMAHPMLSSRSFQ
jgi:hypothetical protein